MSNITRPIPLPAVFVRDGKIFANSRDVATLFRKEHKNVLQDIDNLLKSLASENSAAEDSLFVLQKEWHEAANREVRSFDMSRDGFTLLVMGYTGQKALAFKLRYIEAFNRMEEALLSPISTTPPC